MSQSIAKINAAVDACLAAINDTVDPRAELRAYLAMSELTGELTTEELRTVETVVFRIILDREQRGRYSTPQ